MMERYMNEWNHTRWESNLQGVGGDLGRPEHHQVLEGWRPTGTPSEASLDVNLDPSTNGWLVGYRDEELPPITPTTGAALLNCWPALPAHIMGTPPIFLRAPSPPFGIVTETQNIHARQQLLPTERPRSPENRKRSPALSCSPDVCSVASSVIGEVSRDPMSGNVAPPRARSTPEGESESPTEKSPQPLQDVLAALKVDEGQSHHIIISPPPTVSSKNDRESSASSYPSKLRREESPSGPSGSGYGFTGRTLRKRSLSKTAPHPATPSSITKNPAMGRVLRPKLEQRNRPQPPEPIVPRKATGNPLPVVSASKRQSSRCDTSKLDRKPSLSRQEISPAEPTTCAPQKRRHLQLESVTACNSDDEDDGNATDDQNLEARLIKWGFVRRGHLHCPCGMTFARRWDARRHWVNSSIHKAERQRLGDFSDSTRFRCTKCKEVMSRKDSLRRHMASCGLRKKRRYRSGWNPNATCSEKAGSGDSGEVSANISLRYLRIYI